MVDSKINFKFDKQSLINIQMFMNESHAVKIGVLANNIRPEGFGAVELACVHEFGSQIRRIPQRSFLRKTQTTRMRDFKNEIAQNRQKIMESIAQGNGNQFLGKVGATWVRYVNETFDMEGPGWKPLSPKTIANRRLGSDKILQDTGEMKKSITFAIE